MRLLSVALLVALAIACAPPTEAPEIVAEHFWEAVRVGNFDAARSLATAPTAELVASITSEQSIESVLLGETLKSEGSAVVRTEIVTPVQNGKRRTRFDTHLVHEPEGWRVDARATRRDLTTALFASAVSQLSEIVEEGMQELGDALEESAADLAREIHEALEELETSPSTP